MTGFVEEGVLRFEGLIDADIAALNRVLPDMIYYVELARKERSRFNALVAVLAPIIEKILQKQQELKA